MKLLYPLIILLLSCSTEPEDELPTGCCKYYSSGNNVVYTWDNPYCTENKTKDSCGEYSTTYDNQTFYENESCSEVLYCN